MNLGIKNKNVLITGASQNIGRSIAINMAREGCNIAICARNKENLNDLKNKHIDLLAYYQATFKKNVIF